MSWSSVALAGARTPDDALVDGAGLVVTADVAPVAVRPVSDGLGGRGEQVHSEPDERVELVQQPQVGGAVVPVVERVPTDDVPFFCSTWPLSLDR